MSSRTIPTICAYSRNFSLGLRRVIISYRVKSTCPPSNAGMGSRFMKASISESQAWLSKPASVMWLAVGSVPRRTLERATAAQNATAAIGDYNTDSGLRLQCSQMCGRDHAHIEALRRRKIRRIVRDQKIGLPVYGSL